MEIPYINVIYYYSAMQNFCVAVSLNKFIAVARNCSSLRDKLKTTVTI